MKASVNQTSDDEQVTDSVILNQGVTLTIDGQWPVDAESVTEIMFNGRKFVPSNIETELKVNNL